MLRALRFGPSNKLPSPPSPPLSDTDKSFDEEPSRSRPRPKFSIASLSLGTNLYHSLPRKIEVAGQLGYDGIELFIPDFEAFVQEVGVGAHADLLRRFPPPSEPSCSAAASRISWLWAASSTVSEVTVDAQNLLEIRCAQVIGDYCASLGLTIPVLQPFRNFENLFARSDGRKNNDTSRLNAALAQAEKWLKLMKYLRTDLLLVCSNALPLHSVDVSPSEFTSATVSHYTPPPSPVISCTEILKGERPVHQYWKGKEWYRQDLIRSFRALGTLASQYNIRIGYEALAWGTIVNRWEQVWDVVLDVDLPNVGIILDSFNQLCVLFYSFFFSTSKPFVRSPHCFAQVHVPFIAQLR